MIESPIDNRERRLNEVLFAYVEAKESGKQPSRFELLAAHPDLRAELEEFFKTHDEVERVAAPLRIAVRDSVVETPSELGQLGDFKLLREIGRGGMGVVYEAVQISLGRRVALKVLPFAATLDARQLQRFRNEAQAAAGLHHTNIVPVYFVGCERGMHFYAMQLIEGRTLDAVIRELREEAGVDDVDHEAATLNLRRAPTKPSVQHSQRGRSGCRTAARLAAVVADALEYAHDQGVVHRDIKPANLLIDAKGNVWVADFGLAQISADVSLTRTGDLLGTLRYMSPEQAAGRHFLVDQRSDVYSLGATLYELLTLKPVFPGHDRQTLLQQILNDDPLPLRNIDRSIPIELETIVLKALAKSPGDRYATAGEMAADLHRFLDERPILARRPSLIDRGRKWAKRHPTLVGAAIILLAFGFVVSAASTALIAREQKRTRNALDLEKERAHEAEERFKLAQRSADEMIRIANEELSDSPEQQFLRRRLLETALAYYQEFIALRPAQVDLEVTRDQIRSILADLAVLDGAWQHMLLTQIAVRDELKLTDARRKELDELFRDVGASRIQPMNAKTQSQQFIEEVRFHETEIRRILSSEQLKRLRQIALQVRGPLAFRQPDVIATLELLPEQQQAIRAIEKEMMFIRRDGPRGGPPPFAGEPPRRNDPPPRPPVERILEVLRDDQRAKWKAMIGEEFRFRVGAGFPGGPGGFGPGGPGGPGGFGPGGKGGPGGFGGPRPPR